MCERICTLPTLDAYRSEAHGRRRLAAHRKPLRHNGGRRVQQLLRKRRIRFRQNMNCSSGARDFRLQMFGRLQAERAFWQIVSLSVTTRPWPWPAQILQILIARSHRRKHETVSQLLRRSECDIPVYRSKTSRSLGSARETQVWIAVLLSFSSSSRISSLCSARPDIIRTRQLPHQPSVQIWATLKPFSNKT